jgi:WD40 repeat protein
MAVVHRCVLIVGLLVALPCRADIRILDNLGHNERINAIVRADAAGLVYSGSRDGRIKAHRLSDGRPVGEFRLQAGRYLSALAVNPVKPTVLAVGTTNAHMGDPRVVIFDAARAQRVRELEGGAHALQYSPDGRYLVGNLFGEINIWLPDDGTLYVSLRCDDGSSVQFLDGHTLAFVTNKKLRRLDLDAGQILGEDPLPFGTKFVILRGAQNVLLVAERKAVLWNLQRATATSEHTLLTSPDVIAYDPLSGEVFLGQTSAVALGNVHFPMYRLFGPGLTSMHGLQGADQVPTALNAQAGLLIVGQGDGRLRRWRFQDKKVETLPDLGTRLPAVSALATSADDRYIAVADLDGTVDILDTDTGVQRTFDPHVARHRPPPPRFGSEKTIGVTQTFTFGERKRRPRVNDMAFFGAGNVFAVSYDDGDLRIVDATTLAEQPADPERGTRGISLVPLDKDRMLMSSERGVHMWNKALARRERTIPVSLAASFLRQDAGRTLLLAGNRDNAEVWTVGGKLVHRVSDFSGCAVLFKGRLIRSDFNNNRSLAVWNLATQSPEAPLPGPTDLVSEKNCVATQSQAFFVQWDGRAWIVEEAGNGQLRSKQYDTRTQVHTVAVSNKSKVLLLGGPQRSVTAIDIASSRRLGRMTIFDNEEWLAVDANNHFDGPPQMWSRLRFADTTRPLYPLDPGLGFEALFLPETLRVVMGLAPGATAAETKTPVAMGPPPEVSIQTPQSTYRLRYGLAQESSWSEPGKPSSPTIRSVQVGEEYGLLEADAKLPNAPIQFRAQAIDRGGGIGSCRLERNHQVVQTFLPPTPAKERALFAAQLAPLSGDNELSFECFDKQGLRSDPAQVNVMVEPSPVPTGTAYIVAIGIDEYVANDKKLRYAVSDARFAAETLARTLATTGRYARTKPVVLPDGAANRATVLAVLDRLAGRPGATSAYDGSLQPVRPEDAVVVYFSGHGGNLDGQYQLLMQEFDGTQGKGLLSDEELRERFVDMNARDLMLIIDACESGKTLGTGQQRIGPFASRGFAQMAYDKGLFVLAASQADAAALELQSLSHGLLTHVLVQLGIAENKADRDPQDGTTTVRELFQFAVEQVPIVHRDKRVAREIQKDASRGGQVYYDGVEQDDDLGYLQVPRAYVPAFGYNSDFVVNRVKAQ